MPTLNQLIKNCRKFKIKKCKTPHLQHCPQRSAFCDKLKVRSPKKPNSAKRKVAHLLTLQEHNPNVIAYLPGENNCLIVHAKVLYRGGRTKDLPGLRYKVIPGKYGAPYIEGRKTSRSKYGERKTKLLY